MICKSDIDAEHLLKRMPFSRPEHKVAFTNSIDVVQSTHRRIHFYFGCDCSQLSSLLIEMLRFVGNGIPIVWIEKVELMAISSQSFFYAIRKSVGETRLCWEAPVHQFEDFESDSYCRSEMDTHQIEELERFVGVLAAVAIGEWDAKFFCSENDDYFEFWEGNILFYSKDPNRLELAKKLFAKYGISEPMT